MYPLHRRLRFLLAAALAATTTLAFAPALRAQDCEVDSLHACMGLHEGCDPLCPLTLTQFKTVSTPDTNFYGKLRKAGAIALIQQGSGAKAVALDNARQVLGKAGFTIVNINNLAGAIAAINNAYTANGNRPIHVIIVGHGRPGSIKVGEDRINNDTPAGQANKNALQAAVAGKLENLVLVGCKVGAGQKGQDFLDKLVADFGVPIHAWTGAITPDPVAKTFLVEGVKRQKGSRLLDEHFSYANGNLAGVGGWYAHSGAGNVPVQVVGFTARLQQGAGSREDVNIPFPVQPNTATTFASFTLKVATGSVMGTGTEYIAHFRPAAPDTNLFRARVFIGPSGVGGNYAISIGVSGLPFVSWPTGLVFGETYRIVVSYDALTGTSDLWVNPISQSSPKVSQTVPSAVGSNLGSFAFRQATPTGATTTQFIDDLIVAESFEEALPVDTQVPAMPAWGLALVAGLLSVVGASIVMRRAAA